MKDENTREIIRRLGGVSKIANALGISKAAVSKWVVIPAKRCKQIEKLFHGEVTRVEMRPDIFG